MKDAIALLALAFLLQPLLVAAAEPSDRLAALEAELPFELDAETFFTELRSALLERGCHAELRTSRVESFDFYAQARLDVAVAWSPESAPGCFEFLASQRRRIEWHYARMGKKQAPEPYEAVAYLGFTVFAAHPPMRTSREELVHRLEAILDGLPAPDPSVLEGIRPN